jgi:K+-transporting ATPase ATPase C chain
MKAVISNLRLHFAMLLLCGGLYPALVLVVGQFIPQKAEGQSVMAHGRVLGFANIGQANQKPGYFWPRPSAVAYNAASTGGSNKGPTNPDYLKTVAERVVALQKAHPTHAKTPIPADLVTASGSGIDPHISPQAALYQIDRVAAARGLSTQQVLALVDEATQTPLLGPPSVNVLQLNLKLDNLELDSLFRK